MAPPGGIRPGRKSGSAPLRVVGLLIVIAVGAGLLYLFFWPVPIDPAAWTPAPSPGFSGSLARNKVLAGVEYLAVGAAVGPEDVAVDSEGRIYGGYFDGRILRLPAGGGAPEIFARTDGRPLGLHFDAGGNLIVADSVRGLLSVSPAGEVTTLTTRASDGPFRFADDVDIARDGRIYFSDASYRYSDATSDIVENRPHGRLLVFDPAVGSTRTLLRGLYFANGVAVSPDQSFVLVCETARYRIRRYWLVGPRAGQDDIFRDNLPGFPDGISSNGVDGFWLALYGPRPPLLDALQPHPFWRKVVFRLPRWLRPAPARHAIVLGLDLDARVTYNLQDDSPSAYAPVTSAQQHGDQLYLGSLLHDRMARLPLQSLPPRSPVPAVRQVN